MNPPPSHVRLSREVILAVYAESSEDVIVLVERLVLAAFSVAIVGVLIGHRVRRQSRSAGRILNGN